MVKSENRTKAKRIWQSVTLLAKSEKAVTAPLSQPQHKDCVYSKDSWKGWAGLNRGSMNNAGVKGGQGQGGFE